MDKRQVVEVAYRSFLETFTCPAKFIIDKSEPWIIEMVRNRGDVVELDTPDWQSGNETSFLLQLNLAIKQNENVLLLEDDYLWVNRNSQNILDKAIKELGFVSPYDHPNHYFEEGYNRPRKVIVASGHHWQNVVSTTLTFGAKPDLIRDYWPEFTTHGTVDDLMWRSIDHKLWSPIPSLAIHMEEDFISPTFKWENIIQKYL